MKKVLAAVLVGAVLQSCTTSIHLVDKLRLNMAESEIVEAICGPEHRHAITTLTGKLVGGALPPDRNPATEKKCRHSDD